MIGFIGSVFSPWYAWSGRGDPANHCCINVTTCGPGGRFTMTDRGRGALRATRDSLQVGPSSMTWAGDRLLIDIDEIGAPPMVSRVRGRITILPQAISGVELPLTPDGAHIWRPFAPRAAIRVDLDAAGWRWDGHGYFDANFGSRPLESDFRFWTWGRFPTRDGALCIYDAERRDGSRMDTAVSFDAAGGAKEVGAPGRVSYRRTFWRMPRETRADPGTVPRPGLMLLDAPFYARSTVTTRIGGEEMTGVHEALDLDRYRQPWLKPMLAMRVPRRARWRSDA